MRSADLADDHATIADVMHHAASWMGGEGYACCLYATAAFVSADDLRRGAAMLLERACDYVLSVAAYPTRVQKAIRVRDGRVSAFYPDQMNRRTQDLEPAYFDAAQFCWGAARSWLRRRPVFSSDTIALVIPAYRAQDIDTEEDWQQAEMMFPVLHGKD